MATTESLNVIVFPGGFNLPTWSAIHCGAFAAQALDIKLHFTTNSVQQLTGLIGGEWELGLTGFDNIVAYQEGQGEAPLDRIPDLFAFMGGDNAFLKLLVQPDIQDYADLKGKTLSVDALTTGFAFVLRKMLARNGVGENEVQFERAGGVLQRFEALKEGKHAGTLVVTPFDIIGGKFGLRVLQSASELLPHYQGICGAARRGWAKENPELLVRFIRAYVDGLRWLYDRGNQDAACKLLVDNVPNMSVEMAQATYTALTAEPGGFDPRARLDIAGVETVLKLRSEYGRPQKNLTETRKYDDLNYYERASQAV